LLGAIALRLSLGYAMTTHQLVYVGRNFIGTPVILWCSSVIYSHSFTDQAQPVLTDGTSVEEHEDHPGITSQKS